MEKHIYTLVFVFLLGLSTPALAQMYDGNDDIMRTNADAFSTRTSANSKRQYSRDRNGRMLDSRSSAYPAFPQSDVPSNGLSSSSSSQDNGQPNASRSHTGGYRSNIHRPFTDINGNSYGPRKLPGKPGEIDVDENSPVGSPLVLILFAAVAALFRRKRE